MENSFSKTKISNLNKNNIWIVNQTCGVWEWFFISYSIWERLLLKEIVDKICWKILILNSWIPTKNYFLQIWLKIKILLEFNNNNNNCSNHKNWKEEIPLQIHKNPFNYWEECFNLKKAIELVGKNYINILFLFKYLRIWQRKSIFYRIQHANYMQNWDRQYNKMKTINLSSFNKRRLIKKRMKTSS